MKDDYARVASLYDYLQKEFPVTVLIDFIFKYFEKKGFKPKTILDLGCGTGTLLLEMEKKGLKCFGLDASPGMIGIAKQKSKTISFSVGDMTLFVMKDKVDLVTAVSSPLYMNNFDKNQKTICFSTAFKNLKPGGYFVFDVMNFEHFEEYLAKKSKKFPITSKFEHEGKKYNTSIDRVSHDIISVKIFDSEDNNLVLEQVYQRGNVEDIKKELASAGFSDVYLTINKMGVHKDYLFFAKKGG
ncbi:class I SAM-dependent methyltransferase [Candidatus Woesearchaeota archaeon]|nr:class I SAM-dependent methyltransferase [Candidatus Woesearchaeota archaeon]